MLLASRPKQTKSSQWSTDHNPRLEPQSRFKSVGRNLLQRVINLQNYQRDHTPYGKADANKFLFGKDARRVAQDFAQQANNGGELGEFYEQALNPSANRADLYDEFGDVLWQVINIGLQYGIDVKEALQGALDKRLQRLGKVEEYARAEGQEISRDMPMNKWLKFWRKAKKALSDPQMKFDFDKFENQTTQQLLF